MPTSHRFNPSTNTTENTPTSPPNPQTASFALNQVASHSRTLEHLITQAEWQLTEFPFLSYIPTHIDRNHGSVIPRSEWDFPIFEDPPVLREHIRFGDVPLVERSGRMQRPRPRPPTPPPPRPLSCGSDAASTNDENYHENGRVTIRFPDPNRSPYRLIPTRARERFVRSSYGNRHLNLGQLQPMAPTVPVQDIIPITTLNNPILGERITFDLPIRPKSPSRPSAAGSMKHHYMHTGSLPDISQLQLDDYPQGPNSTIKIAQAEMAATVIGNDAKSQANANATHEAPSEATNPQQQQSSSTSSKRRRFGFRKSKSTPFFFVPLNCLRFPNKG